MELEQTILRRHPNTNSFSPIFHLPYLLRSTLTITRTGKSHRNRTKTSTKTTIRGAKRNRQQIKNQFNQFPITQPATSYQLSQLKLKKLERENEFGFRQVRACTSGSMILVFFFSLAEPILSGDPCDVCRLSLGERRMGYYGLCGLQGPGIILSI